MTYEDKVEYIEQYLELGLGFCEACLLSEMTEEEEDQLADDPDFQRKIMFHKAKLERALLERHDSATRIAEARGTGMGALQWRLEKLNPARYSNNKDSGEEAFTGKVVINVVRGKAEDQE